MFQKKSVIGIHLIFAVLFIMDSSVVGSPLSVHPTNPHYFTNKSGKAIYMTGSHTWYILHEEGHPITEDRLRSYLDWIKSWNHNYIRIWSNWFPMKNDMGFQHPWPYMRTGPGLAHDGLPKFDLTKPSKDYFNLLRFFINESQKRQLYCSVMLFGSFVAWKEEQNKFKTNVAWAPDNNVNPETRVLEVGKDFFKMDKDLLEIQKAHVRNVIDALNEYDNFVWEIMNEAMFPESKEWQYYIIDYIHAYEKTKKKQHLVIMSGGPGEMKDILEKSNADIISPAWSSNGKYFLGGPASYSDKIVINDTDHLWAFTESNEIEPIRKWIWKTFMRGNHPIFMDDYDSYLNNNNGKINPAFDPIRKNMGHTVEYSIKLKDLAVFEPNENVCSTRYCLHNRQKEFLIYHPGKELDISHLPFYLKAKWKLICYYRSKFVNQKSLSKDFFAVDIEKGKYQFEWFDPKDESDSLGAVDINKSGWHKFKIPSHISDDSVFYLKRNNAS